MHIKNTKRVVMRQLSRLRENRPARRRQQIMRCRRIWAATIRSERSFYWYFKHMATTNPNMYFCLANDGAGQNVRACCHAPRHARTHARARARTHARMCACTHAYAHTHTPHARTSTHTHIHLSSCSSRIGGRAFRTVTTVGAGSSSSSWGRGCTALGSTCSSYHHGFVHHRHHHD